MAKKKKIGTANPWDTPSTELKNVAKSITSEPSTPLPQPSEEKEPLAVLRIRKSYHLRAKTAAASQDLTLQNFIEKLIDDNIPE